MSSSSPTLYDTSKIFQRLFGNQTFVDFEDFEGKFNAFQQQTGIIFRIKSSVSVGAENKKRAIKIHDKFKYGGVTYICVRHGTNKVKGASCNCKAYLSLSYKTSIQKLYITSANTQHNHPLPIKNSEVLVIPQEEDFAQNIVFDNASERSTYLDNFYQAHPYMMERNGGSVKSPNPDTVHSLKRDRDPEEPSNTIPDPNKIAKLDSSANDGTNKPPAPPINAEASITKNSNPTTPSLIKLSDGHNYKPVAPSTRPLAAPPLSSSSSHNNPIPPNPPAHAPIQQHQTHSLPQSKYAQLLAVIEDMGRDIRPAYAGSKVAAERLKRGIVHSRILVRECLLEAEKCART